MVRAHLPMAMQGLAVVPLFAGYDLRRRRRAHLHLRRHRRPLRGDATSTRPARAAATPRTIDQARLPRGPEPRRGRRARRRTRSTRRPTRTRRPAGPTRCAASTRSSRPSTAERLRAARRRRGRRALRRRCWPRRSRPARRRPDDDGGDALMSMPFYVAPEQVMKDRAEYAQKGIARGRSLVAVTYDDGILIVRREPVAAPCTRSARSTTGSPSPASASTTSSTSCASPAIRHADIKGYAYSPRGRRRPRPRQRLRPVPRPGLHPRDEAARGRDPRRRGRPERRPRTGSTTSPTTARSSTRSASRSSAARPRSSRAACSTEALVEPGMATSKRRSGRSVRRLGGPRTAVTARPTTSRWRVLAPAQRRGGPSAASRAAELAALLLGDLRPSSATTSPGRARSDTGTLRRGTLAVARGWSGASSGSRTSTASPAPSAGSAG